MATPSGQDKSKHGAGIKIALHLVTCAALMCSGFAKDFGFASPFPWNKRNLRRKTEMPSSGQLQDEAPQLVELIFLLTLILSGLLNISTRFALKTKKKKVCFS